MRCPCAGEIPPGDRPHSLTVCDEMAATARPSTRLYWSLAGTWRPFEVLRSLSTRRAYRDPVIEALLAWRSSLPQYCCYVDIPVLPERSVGPDDLNVNACMIASTTVMANSNRNCSSPNPESRWRIRRSCSSFDATCAPESALHLDTTRASPVEPRVVNDSQGLGSDRMDIADRAERKPAPPQPP